jgi:hypothetical protein
MTPNRSLVEISKTILCGLVLSADARVSTKIVAGDPKKAASRILYRRQPEPDTAVHLSAPVAALGHVMQQVRNDVAGDAGHGRASRIGKASRENHVLHILQ